MKNFNENEIIEILFSGQYYYNTAQWVEFQSLLLSKMVKNKDFSSLEIMIKKASKREDYQVIEFICAHLTEKWGSILWDSIKNLISCKSRDGRYRAIFLYSFLAKDFNDYIKILECLNDEYQDVRLIAYNFIIRNKDIYFNILNEQLLPIKFNYLNDVYLMSKNLTSFELKNYYDYSSVSPLQKKAIFLVFLSKISLIEEIKVVIDILDDQDLFDYFYKFLLDNK